MFSEVLLLDFLLLLHSTHQGSTGGQSVWRVVQAILNQIHVNPLCLSLFLPCWQHRPVGGGWLSWPTATSESIYSWHNGISGTRNVNETLRGRIKSVGRLGENFAISSFFPSRQTFLNAVLTDELWRLWLLIWVQSWRGLDFQPPSAGVIKQSWSSNHLPLIADVTLQQWDGVLRAN